MTDNDKPYDDVATQRIALSAQVGQIDTELSLLNAKLRKSIAYSRYYGRSDDSRRQIKELAEKKEQLVLKKHSIQQELVSAKLEMRRQQVSGRPPLAETVARKAAKIKTYGEHGEVFAREFVETAKEVLAPPVFEHIKSTAMQRIREREYQQYTEQEANTHE